MNKHRVIAVALFAAPVVALVWWIVTRRQAAAPGASQGTPIEGDQSPTMLNITTGKGDTEQSSNAVSDDEQEQQQSGEPVGKNYGGKGSVVAPRTPEPPKSVAVNSKPKINVTETHITGK